MILLTPKKEEKAMRDNANAWEKEKRAEYEKLKTELKASSIAVGSVALNHQYGTDPPPYFYNGMQSYAEAEGDDI